MKFTWYTYAKAIHDAEIDFNKAFVDEFTPYSSWAAVSPESRLSKTHRKLKLLKDRKRREKVQHPARMIREIYHISLERKNPLP